MPSLSQAAAHNKKAKNKVVGEKEARRKEIEEKKENLENDLAAHAARAEEQLQRRAEKGAAEGEKVSSAVAALHETAADAAAQDRAANDRAMAAAAERRATQVAEVAAKGAAEGEKVDRAAAREMQDCSGANLSYCH